MKAGNPTLVAAINEKRRISFIYNNKRRIAEPQCYGIGTKGTELLRVHQLEGLPSESHYSMYRRCRSCRP